MCGAPDQDTLPALEVSAKEAVLHGFVRRDGSAVTATSRGVPEWTREVPGEVEAA